MWSLHGRGRTDTQQRCLALGYLVAIYRCFERFPRLPKRPRSPRRPPHLGMLKAHQQLQENAR
jgi:hypothetical protein